MKKNEIGKDRRMVSIKVKLLGAIIPVVAVAIIALLVSTYGSSDSIITGFAEDTLRTSARANANQISSWAKSTLAELNMLKITLDSAGFSAEEEKQFIKHTSGVNQSYPDGIYIGDSGEGFITAADWPLPENFTITDRPWYQNGLEQEAFRFGVPYFDSNKSVFVVTASASVGGADSSVKKVAGVDVYLSRVSEMMEKLNMEAAGNSFLVDNSSKLILADADVQMAGSALDAQENSLLYRNLASVLADQNVQDTVSVEGEDGRYMAGIAPVEGTDWTLVTYTSRSEILSKLDSFQLFMVIITVLVILALIILSERVVHFTIKPVKKLTLIIENITEGDFTVNIDVKGNDEVAVMSRSLQRFIEVMRDIATNITGISDSLKLQASQSSDISNELYTTSEAQAVSMKELNRTVDELARANTEIADSATDLAGIAANVRDDGKTVGARMQDTVAVSDQGKKDMENVDQAMTKVENSILSLEEAVGEVGRATTQITDIVQLIGSIANQTNLLSLNAAIEAARSGEAGKGFAVVADQIGKLADDSRNSVREIAALTENICGLVEDTVKKTQSSSAEIKEGGEIVKETKATFNNIYSTVLNTSQTMQEMVSKINRVDEVAASMAAITEEQAAVADQISATSNDLLNHSGKITDNGAAVAQNAIRLKETSEDLSVNMKKFKVK